jgi:hypothetical protein
MIRVKIATGPYRKLIRQLPPLDGFEFRINDTEPECDWLVAFDGPWEQPMPVRCPRERRIQVQFHDFVADADRRMAAIQSRLRATHHTTYQYPYVWENWALNA